MRTKAEAVAAGRKALTMLRNRRGWEVRVWENMGWWFVELHTDYVRVQIEPSNTESGLEFRAIISRGRYGHGSPASWCQCDNKHFRDPVDAVAYAIKGVVKEMTSTFEVVTSVNKTIRKEGNGILPHTPNRIRQKVRH